MANRKRPYRLIFLGALFALAFCPYSAVLFFGVLIHLVLNAGEGLILPPIFALGTDIPVIMFSFLIVFGMQKVSQAFQLVQKVKSAIRRVAASIFMITGIYFFIYWLSIWR